MSSLEPLLKLAFATAPAAEANQAIAAQRAQLGDGAAQALSYECVVEPTQSLHQLAQALLPRLVYFLDCRGISLGAVRGVFLTLFVGDTMHFVDTTAALQLLAPALGLSLEGLRAKYGAN